jgi:hypothetical protein
MVVGEGKEICVRIPVTCEKIFAEIDDDEVNLYTDKGFVNPLSVGDKFVELRLTIPEELKVMQVMIPLNSNICPSDHIRSRTTLWKPENLLEYYIIYPEGVITFPIVNGVIDRNTVIENEGKVCRQLWVLEVVRTAQTVVGVLFLHPKLFEKILKF